VSTIHILFVHKNFPAQFGHIAGHLVKNKGYRCTFVSEKSAGWSGGIERIQYKLQGGATSATNFCSRSFENAIWHSEAIFHTLKSRPDIQPDLIVGHSGFACTLFLRELYDCPIINYFEYFYRTTGSDVDFRKDFPLEERSLLRVRARNAMLLLDLDDCDAGYSPTGWQRSRLPKQYQDKIHVIFDGIDTNFWQPVKNVPRVISGKNIPDDVKIVTYVSRGLESMRGFDIFMKVAKTLCDRRNDVIFVVVGEDRICYGGDERFIGGNSFKQWVLSQEDYDLSRILFLNRIPPRELANLFSITNLHLYLTVPFVLSWSLMNALACGAVVLASDTAPVKEMIEHGTNGLLADFFDIEQFANDAEKVLDAPNEFAPLGEAGIDMIREKYSLDVCLPKMLDLYSSVLNQGV